MISVLKNRLYEYATYRRGQRRISELRDYLRTNEPILLVHQMGRAGSMSTVATLQQANISMPVYHTHQLNPSNVQLRLDSFAGRLPHHRLPLNVQVSRTISEAIGEKGLDQRHWNVVSVFRDPVGRNLSGFFLMIDQYIPDFYTRHARGEIDHQFIREVFLEKFHHNGPAVWFDEEVRDVFGIDVYERPFPMDQGYQIFREDNVSLLIIKVENLDTCYADAFSNFLDVEIQTLHNRHVRESETVKNVYREFQKGLCLPPSLLDELYDSRYARHFYSKKEIERQRAKWSGVASDNNLNNDHALSA